ncbi:MAG: thioredoxin family protein [Planctomycetota bacterium]|jgi:thioredoxin 1
MKYVTTIVVLLLCGAVLLGGCSKEVLPKQGRESSPPPPVEVVAFNEANFDAQIEQGVVLVHFWAAWAGPCRTQDPIVEQVAERIGGAAKVAKLDVYAFPRIARRLNISSIPTLIVFKNGKPVQQFVGVTQAQTLVSAIQAALDSQN